MKWNFIVIVGVVLGVAFWTIGYALRDGGSQPLPVLGQVADFQLTDSLGNLVSSDDLEGNILVTDFIFTTCASMCPIMTRHMAALHDRFQNRAGVKMVSISVNPEYDTPAILNNFSTKIGADPKRWVFLTGSRDAIEHLAVDSFKIGSVDEPIFHSGYFVLVDRDMKIRGYYDGMEKASVSRLTDDIEVLLKEESK